MAFKIFLCNNSFLLSIINQLLTWEATTFNKKSSINHSVSLLYNVILINEIPKAKPIAIENSLNKSIFEGLKV